MKKGFRKSAIVCCMLVGALGAAGLSSCSIGGGTVTFETNGGSYIPPINVNAGDSVPNLSGTSKIGYKFLGWCYDEALETQTVTRIERMGDGDITLYAKYEIDEPSFYDWMTFSWGEGASVQREADLSQSINYYLLDKTTRAFAFSRISLTAAEGSAFVCKSIIVSDANGRVLEDVDPAPETWVSATPLGASEEAKYVICIEASDFGAANVLFSAM